MTPLRLQLLALSICGTALVGCGGKDVVPVHGKVNHLNNAVTSGALVFSPIAKDDELKPGKSATGDIQPDGTYQLSTHGRHDGAVVGRHRVRYIPSLEDAKKRAGGIPPQEVMRLTLPTDYEVEIKSGEDNEVDIDLVKRS